MIDACIYVNYVYYVYTYVCSDTVQEIKVVHKQMSILTFKGLSTTFQALANVSLVIYIYC